MATNQPGKNAPKTDGKTEQSTAEDAVKNPNAFEIETRVAKDKPKHKTSGTLDWTGVTMDDLKILAAPTVIIREQARWRNEGKIPATATIKVAEVLTRKRAAFVPTPDNLAAKAEVLTAAERRALIEKLQAGLK